MGWSHRRLLRSRNGSTVRRGSRPSFLLAGSRLARLTRAALVGALLAALAAGPSLADENAVDVQLLAFNDFHGWLEPPTGSDGRIGSTEAGGLVYLTSHLARLRASNPNTIV